MPVTTLPFELWTIIFSFLSVEDLRCIYWVDRRFYDAYLSEEFKTVDVPGRIPAFRVARLLRTRDPQIARRAATLKVNFDQLSYLSFPLRRPSSVNSPQPRYARPPLRHLFKKRKPTSLPPTDDSAFTCSDVFNTLLAFSRSATSLETLIISFSDSRASQDAQFLAQLWEIVKDRIRSLDIRLVLGFSEGMLPVFRDFSPCFSSISVKVSWGKDPNANSISDSAELVRIFSQVANSITHLKLWDSYHVLPAAFDDLPPFPRLKHAELELPMDSATVDSMMKAFTASSFTSLHWTVSASQTPSGVSPLSRLNTPHLRTLHLDLHYVSASHPSPSSHPINIMFSEPLNMESLANLTIANIRLKHTEFSTVISCFQRSSCAQRIQDLAISVNTLTPYTMDSLFSTFPSLRELVLTVGRIGDGRLGPTFSMHQFTTLMNDRDYSAWTLQDLSIVYWDAHLETDLADNAIKAMRPLVRAAPSIKIFNGKSVSDYPSS